MSYDKSKQLNREVQLLNENIEMINNFICHDDVQSEIVHNYCVQLNHTLKSLTLTLEGLNGEP